MFNNFSIARKIALGFFVILLLTVVGVTVSGWGISSVTSQFSGLVDSEFAAIRHVGNTKIALLEARRPEKDLLYADDPTLVKAANGFMDAMLKEAADTEAVTKTMGEPVLIENGEAISKLAADYRKQFQTMAAAPIGQERMVAALAIRKTAKDMETRLNEFLAAINKRIAARTDSAKAHASTTIVSAVGVGSVALVLGILLAVAISRAVTRPLERMRSAIVEVQHTGEFRSRVGYNRQDEVGQAAQAFDALMDSLEMAVSQVNTVVGAVAAGDFNQRVEAELKGDLKMMKDAVNASARSVKVTMAALNEVMQSLQAGDFSQRMSAEVKGDVKQAVDQAMQAMQAMLGNVGAVMSKVSDGDLKQRVTAEGRGDLAALKENINASLAAMSKVLGAVSSNTQQVAAASNQTSSAIGQISDGAQNQMHAINQVATAVQQTAASVTDVAKAAESANSRAQSMGQTVNESMADMNRMVDIVQTIAANADRIDKITDVIEKIANKTNLLSLNAAIEAARAGEHGKGFAVVAEEVGKLAASAAESTQEITALVKQAVEDADRASETVTVVNKGMQGIAQGARQTEAELQRISAAMEQQNAAITEINANVGSLNKIASANASAAEEITATVMELARLADGTRREVAMFSV